MKLTKQEEGVLSDLQSDTAMYAENFCFIVDKNADLKPLVPSLGQLELEKALQKQRSEQKPQRAIVLKARQVGMSTWVQAKLIQRTTLVANQHAIVVAHDVATGSKLYRMGEKMYQHLPDDDPIIKPPIRATRRGRMLHFAQPGKDAWKRGDLYPDSIYEVDTAQEFESGRGGTYQLAHLSEFAFWERPIDKLTALMQGVSKTHNSMVVIESTANGVNVFKDIWDDAVAGRSDFAPVFWPWYKEDQYALKFLNEAEKESFEKQVGTGEYGEDEPQLLALMGEDPLLLEKLHWRRRSIASECAGKLDKFHQEYPATPEEAFIASGRGVFSAELVKGVLVSCEVSDPRSPTRDIPGPDLGSFVPRDQAKLTDRHGNDISVPVSAAWVSRTEAAARDHWRLWEREPDSQYVIGVDVSGGDMSPEQSSPAYHAIQVIDHRSREQVAEYRSHTDPGLLAMEVLLAALFFKEATVAIEITGGWGFPVARTLHLDYNYPNQYLRRSHENRTEPVSNILGWNTSSKTKPILESSLTELLREHEDGIKSRPLAEEMLAYVRDEKGRTGAQPGRHDDLLMAYMIAQQVANEMPLPIAVDKTERIRPATDPVTGYQPYGV
jgi:hypothetical protein